MPTRGVTNSKNPVSQFPGENYSEWASCSLQGNVLKGSANTRVIYNDSFQFTLNEPSFKRAQYTTAKSHYYLLVSIVDLRTKDQQSTVGGNFMANFRQLFIGPAVSKACHWSRISGVI